MKQSRRQFVKTMFVATAQATVAGSLLPRQLFGAETKADALNFIIFGDWGRNGEKDQRDVAVQMALSAQAIDAKFIISVGDNFYENGVKSVDDPQWQTSFEKVYAAPSLQVPWQVILGNHDYHGNCDAQLAYAKTHPRWNMPARYFVQTLQVDASTTADLFYLDTTPMIKSYYSIFNSEHTRANVLTQDVPKQLAWFKTSLAASTAKWKIVIGHHPIYSGGGHGDTEELVEAILPLLQQYQVQAYFNGHDHDLQHLQAGKLNFFCTGAGSQHRPTVNTPHTKFARACSGFTIVALSADKLDVQMIDDQGRTLYTTSVPRTA